MTEHPFLEVLTKLQYDLTSIQARVADLKRNLALELPAQPLAYRCPMELCGLSFHGPKRLAEHVYVSHDGAEPEHWTASEARSLEPQEAEA